MTIRELLNKQKELDSIIFKAAQLKEYPCKEIKLALLTELGELANEVQCFKYWKQNKTISREKVLEEFADCLHFALSLENHLNQLYEHNLNAEIKDVIKEDLVEENTFDFLYAYMKVISDDLPLIEIMNLGMALGITGEELEQSYLKKYEKNLRRQQEGY